MTLKASEAKDHEKKRKWTENRRHYKYYIAHNNIVQRKKVPQINSCQQQIQSITITVKKKDCEITITKK